MSPIDQVPMLRDEVLAQLGFLNYGMFIGMACMVAAYLVGQISERKTECNRLVLILAITMGFWIAKSDFMIHQLGSYIRLIQESLPATTPQPLPYWDTWRGSLKARPIMMPIVDFGSGLVPLFLVWLSSRQLWRHGQRWFVVIALCGVVFSISAIFAALRYGGI